jgi:glycosyltransferase involved in cell wall biosynthesis
MDRTDFFVVVAFFNEAGGIAATLEAFAAQTDRDFSLVLVDNASTDDGPGVVAAFQARHTELSVEVIAEPRKGTGAAADTGFRHAIARGARYIARTDADCLPRRDWVRNIKRAFERDGLELIGGTLRPRSDELPLTRLDQLTLPLLVLIAEQVPKLVRRGRQYRYPYILVPGNNLAVSASLYVRAGGFPRTAMEEHQEDRTFRERARTLTDRAALRRDVVVQASVRRVKQYGYIRTLLWYATLYKPKLVDVR